MAKILFILGAGFTKAFIDEAFLSVDKDHVPPHLIEKFPLDTHRYARGILDYEVKQGPDIERLMTRLNQPMPHDFERKCTQELDHLSHHIKEHFVKRLQKLKDDRTALPDDLKHFALWCINNEADCISFNYDDFLDHALWDHRKVDDNETWRPFKFWHPNSGYGFFCRPAKSCIRDQNLIMGSSAMLLLKLHGSINWRIKLGAPDLYQLDSILHYEKWIPVVDKGVAPYMYDDPAMLENHLKPERLLVLPVLNKTEIVQQPVFRRIWAEAFERLRKADRIIFIGYSMPRTDIATGFLLREALRDKEDITVVNYVDPSAPESGRDHDALVSAYQTVIPQLKVDNFKFNGAISWITANLQTPCG